MKCCEFPKIAMVFAAGLGTRMRSHRDDIPKPLVPVAGRTLIDRVLDKLVEAGVTEAVVNVSYMGDKIKSHLDRRDDIKIHISHEDSPLETGGGVVKALPMLGQEPFFIVNSDIYWLDDVDLALNRLYQTFIDNSGVGSVLLLSKQEDAVGFDEAGNFLIGADGEIRFPDAGETATHIFSGVQIINPEILQDYINNDIKIFSLREIFVKALEHKENAPIIRGVEHKGKWLHIGDGSGVAAAEKFLD